MLQAMTERTTGSFSAQELLARKDELLAEWDALPAEHQASMALVFVTRTLDGEYREWLHGALDILSVTHASELRPLLPIAAISRAHLAQVNLTPDEIARLDDQDLRDITQTMLDHYTNDVFWEELEFVARLVLANKLQG